MCVAMMFSLRNVELQLLYFVLELFVFLFESSGFLLGVLVVVLVCVAPVLRFGQLYFCVRELLALVFELFRGFFEIFLQGLGFFCSDCMITFMRVALVLRLLQLLLQLLDLLASTVKHLFRVSKIILHALQLIGFCKELGAFAGSVLSTLG